MNHVYRAWKEQWDTTHVCMAVSGRRAVLQGLPASLTTVDQPEHPSQAESPPLPPLEFPWTSEELTQHKDQLLLPATLESCCPLTAGTISLSKPGMWYCMLVYGTLISSGFLMPFVTC